MGKEGGNGAAMKILIPVVVVMITGGIAAGWKLYDNVQVDIRILNEKVGQLAILANTTYVTVTKVDTNVQNLTEWAQKADKNQDRIMTKLGIADPLGESCQPDSTQWTITLNGDTLNTTGSR